MSLTKEILHEPLHRRAKRVTSYQCGCSIKHGVHDIHPMLCPIHYAAVRAVIDVRE